MSLVIRGIGTAVPPFRIDQQDAGNHAVTLCCTDSQQVKALRRFFDRCGVQSRGSVVLEKESGPASARQDFFLAKNGQAGDGPTTAQRMQRYERHSVQLAVAASQAALTHSAASPDSITHLVTVSCSGFNAPGFDVALIEQLGLPATTQRTHIGFMGCHGALNGLRVASAFAQSDPRSQVLLCAVELCSLHFQYGWSTERILANALFADGAAAMVGAAANGPSPTTQPRLLANGSCLIPNSGDAMSWRIGDHGFVMTLSQEVPRLIEVHLRDWMDAWLASNGLTIEEVPSWIVHPGGPKILDAVETALDLPDHTLDESRQVLAEHGNMSSPTVLFILGRLLRQDARRPIVTLGFGPGLTVEAALIG